MAEAKNYIWLFPIIAGVLAFVTILTPAGTMNLLGMFTGNLWLWSFYIYDYMSLATGAEFLTDPLVMIPSLITTVLIAVSGVFLIVVGALLKKNKDLRKIVRPSILLGVLCILSEIIWLVIVPLNFPLEEYLGPAPPGYTYTFWSMSYMGIGVTLHNAGFGIIGGFLTAILAISGAGVAYYYSKEREPKVRDKIETKISEEKIIPREVAKPKFCPECGVQIDDPSVEFCGNCGYQFEGISMQ
ncbi:MAG: zinc ribbon domain-containing protein [Candidatus Thorarchaeota archaeon]